MEQNDVKKLTEDVVASYEARLQIVRGIIESTRGTLEEFREKREEMSEQLRTALAKSANLRKVDFNKMMEDILTAQQRKEENVKNMLANFQKEEEEVLSRLQSLLQRGEGLRTKDFKGALVKIRKDQERREKMTGELVSVELAKMQTEVGRMIESFKKDFVASKEQR